MNGCKIIDGVIITIIAEIVIGVSFNFFMKYKYRYIKGTYKHPNGKVRIGHIWNNRFKAIGKENNSTCWRGTFEINNVRIGKGIYQWDNRRDWGVHELEFPDNKTISVHWINKSEGEFNSGSLIWEKESNI